MVRITWCGFDGGGAGAQVSGGGICVWEACRCKIRFDCFYTVSHVRRVQVSLFCQALGHWMQGHEGSEVGRKDYIQHTDDRASGSGSASPPASSVTLDDLKPKRGFARRNAVNRLCRNSASSLRPFLRHTVALATVSSRALGVASLPIRKEPPSTPLGTLGNAPRQTLRVLLNHLRRRSVQMPASVVRRDIGDPATPLFGLPEAHVVPDMLRPGSASADDVLAAAATGCPYWPTRSRLTMPRTISERCLFVTATAHHPQASRLPHSSAPWDR